MIGLPIDRTLSAVRTLNSATKAAALLGPAAYGGARAGFLAALALTTFSKDGWNFKIGLNGEEHERAAAYGNSHYAAVANAAGLNLTETLIVAGMDELLDGDGLVGPPETMFDQPEDFLGNIIGWYYAEFCSE